MKTCLELNKRPANRDLGLHMPAHYQDPSDTAPGFRIHQTRHLDSGSRVERGQSGSHGHGRPKGKDATPRPATPATPCSHGHPCQAIRRAPRVPSSPPSVVVIVLITADIHTPKESPHMPPTRKLGLTSVGPPRLVPCVMVPLWHRQAPASISTSVLLA